jgi:hypothetical protein
MKTLYICGSRTFDDYPALCAHVDACLVKWDPADVERVIHGDARGADKMGERWALAHGLQVNILRPDWKRLGRSAGFKRNVQLVARANYLIAFWDGRSRGTAHSIQLAQAKGIPFSVYRFPTIVLAFEPVPDAARQKEKSK